MLSVLPLASDRSVRLLFTCVRDDSAVGLDRLCTSKRRANPRSVRLVSGGELSNTRVSCPFSGTVITEFDSGTDICRQLLASDEQVDRAVDALALLMSWHGFDGYLLNIENPIEVIPTAKSQQ